MSYFQRWHTDLWGNQPGRTKNKSITGNATAPSHNAGLMYCILSLRLLLILFMQSVDSAGWKQALKQKVCMSCSFCIVSAWDTSDTFHKAEVRLHVNYVPDNRVTSVVAGEGEALYQLEKTLFFFFPVFHQPKLCCFYLFIYLFYCLSF